MQGKICEKLGEKVTAGAIFDKHGDIWATTPGFYPNPSEFLQFSKSFDFSPDQMNFGIIFCDQHFMIKQHSTNEIIAENSNGVIVLYDCEFCEIFGYNDISVANDDCVRAVEEIAHIIENTPEDDFY